MPTCAEGHVTEATDYCDVCGSPVTSRDAAGLQTRGVGEGCARHAAHRSAVASVRRAATIRHCPSPRPRLSRPKPRCRSSGPPTVTADQDYYKRVIARGGPDTVEFPEFFPERRIILYGNTLIGRTNRKQGVEPGIDLGIQPHRPRRLHATRRPAGPGFGSDVTDLGIDQRNQPQRQRRPPRKRRGDRTRRRRPHSRRRLDDDHGRPSPKRDGHDRPERRAA